jgi:hypothetical protein
LRQPCFPRFMLKGTAREMSSVYARVLSGTPSLLSMLERLAISWRDSDRFSLRVCGAVADLRITRPERMLSVFSDYLARIRSTRQHGSPESRLASDGHDQPEISDEEEKQAAKAGCFTHGISERRMRVSVGVFLSVQNEARHEGQSAQDTCRKYDQKPSRLGPPVDFAISLRVLSHGVSVRGNGCWPESPAGGIIITGGAL